jgi:hypothetical protein
LPLHIHHALEPVLIGALQALGRPHAGAGLLADIAHPVLDLPLGGFAGDAIAFLQLAEQRIAAAFHLVQVVARELAPLLKHFPLQVLPIAFDAFPVHPSLPD